MNPLKEQLFAYVKKTYGAKPDYPFPTAPAYPVLRHPDSGKWFALLMDVPGNRLGLDREERVDVVNLKCSAALSGTLRRQAGILPAYHMHRDSWITVLLDGTVPFRDICELVDLSYTLTGGQKRRGPVNWLVPANPRYYDLAAALRQSPDRSFLWKQSGRVAVGDTVYLYVAAPVSAIRYKCSVREVDIPYPYADEHVHMDRVMRLKVKKTYKKPIGLERLRAHGVTTVRGPRYMPESLLEEIEGKPRR